MGIKVVYNNKIETSKAYDVTFGKLLLSMGWVSLDDVIVIEKK